jgi:hypothetical protein
VEADGGCGGGWWRICQGDLVWLSRGKGKIKKREGEKRKRI